MELQRLETFINCSYSFIWITIQEEGYNWNLLRDASQKSFNTMEYGWSLSILVNKNGSLIGELKCNQEWNKLDN